MSQGGMVKGILIVEHDCLERKTITKTLRDQGYYVIAVADETLAVSIACENTLSLILLDASFLPSYQCELYHQFRLLPQTRQVPLLISAANEQEVSTLIGSGVNGDDFLIKPFLMEELVACVQALARNGRGCRKQKPQRGSRRSVLEKQEEQARILVADDLRIDVARHEVMRRGQQLQVGSPLLFELLVYLVRHRGIVLSPDDLLTQVWGYASSGINNTILRTVYVHVHWLREILEDDPQHPRLIQTVRGVGYRFAG